MNSAVLFIDQNIPHLADTLAECGRVVRFDGRTLTSELIQKEQCTALFVRSVTRVNSILLHNTRVQFVGTATAGTDHIDIDYLNSAGIHFESAAGSNANAVAEYVLFAMLAWSGRMNYSLRGKQVGIIGYGNVGKRVAEYSRRLGMKVFANDPPLSDAGFVFPDWVSYVGIDELCKKSDVITNHVPLNVNGKYPTVGLLGIKELQLLKTGGLVVHASRGGVIDEEMLRKEAQKKQLTLAIDVWNDEPLVDVQLANTAMIATPHIAGYSWNAKLMGARMMAEQFADFYGCRLDFSQWNDTLAEFLPDICTDENTIYNHLRDGRQFLHDTEVFLQTLTLPPAERAIAFDRLRKQYPKRFESLQ